MSIENHEYITNKNNGINILAKEFWLSNDPKFWEFLNKKFDEFLNIDWYSSCHDICKNSRNSNNFYKYLVLCKKGLVNNNLVKNDLEYIVEKGYKDKQFNKYDYSKIYDLFSSYSLFINRISTSTISFYGKNIDKHDFNEFLGSSIINTLFNYWNNSSLYDLITSQSFLNNKIDELVALYEKSKKSKNGSQNWDNFFLNNWQEIITKIKWLFDKYTKSHRWKKDVVKYENDKKEYIKSQIKTLIPSYDNDFNQFLTDIFYELDDNKYLERDFIIRLFFWSNDNGTRILDYKKIQDTFHNAREYISKIKDKKIAKAEELNFNKIKETTKKNLMNFIQNFYSLYIWKSKYLPIFTFTDVWWWNLKNNYPKLLKDSYSISYTNYNNKRHNNFNKDLIRPTNSFLNHIQLKSTTSNGSNWNIQTSNTSSGNEPKTNDSNWNIQTSNISSGDEPKTNSDQEYWQETNIQNLFETVKKTDKFKTAKLAIEKKWIFISDKDVFYVMLYYCSIDNNVNPNQKLYALKMLESNPIASKRWEEFYKNIIGKNINFDSQVVTLNSDWEDELLKQNEKNVEDLNKFLVNVQKRIVSLTDTDDIKKYCISIIPEIKALEKKYSCDNLVAEKINTLISSSLKLQKTEEHDDYNPRWLFMLYLMLTDYENIWKINNDNIDRVIDIVFWEWDDINWEFSDLKLHHKRWLFNYTKHIQQKIIKFDQKVLEYNNKIIARYEMAMAEAENKKFYSDTLINFTKTSNNPQDQSWLQIANWIDNIDKKLNNYKLKSNITKHKEAALRYTAFDTTFNNTFSLNNITIQKLAKSSIDLRSELINYWIYNQENNYFNKDARNKFVSDKIWNIWLTPEEIETLWKTMEELPSEVEKNYEILCGNFISDQNSIERITKIYALGEIIDKIRFLFSNIDKQKLWNFMDIQLDEDEPANVIGDCLFIKWKINGTETNIKYNLRTWKLYMNSFTKQSLNPPMIIVWNTNPDKEIWDLGSFEETISSMDSIFQIQDNEENGEQPWNLWENNSWDNSSDDKDSKQQNGQDPERLIKNKLSNDLKNIWRIAKEKAWEQWKENNVVDDLLKTFNILPDYWEPKDIEFMWWSALFDLLDSIIKTNNENDLLEFSNQMKRLMSLCELSRWKNNENPEKSEFNSVTIFDFNEDNATTDIISLQRAQKKFFSKESGEKDKIKGSKSHFDSSIQLSFADIIVQRCCKDMWNGMEISIIDLERYVDSIEDWLDISNCETKMEEAYN